jgi:hypothetical protein
MSLIGIIQAIQDTVGAITGIRAAPEYPPENLNGIFPFAVCYPSSGEWGAGPGYGTYRTLHNIKLQIHFGRGDLPKSVQAAIPYGDAIAKALLADPSIDASCDTFDTVSYTFGPMSWGEPAIGTVGWEFTLTNVKEIGSVT